ncbi:MAG: circadian clock KaiB family protein [Chitinophagaceae bacterium]|nr:circadian clock KaiB family protein [Chitinophagaceae bacterium]
MYDLMANSFQIDSEEREKIVLQLYITGMSDNSRRAIQNITRLCDQYPERRFDLEIIDIYKDPALAEQRKIVFSPSLIRLFPLPRRTFIGDMSDTRQLVIALGINFKE